MITRTRFAAFLLAAMALAACGGRSDADLTSEAETALKSDPSTANVTVEVKDAVATITGEVADDAAKAKAADLAKVEGIKSVLNNINVAAAPPPLASADDETLRTKVEQALKAQGCGGVIVEVDAGTVTLSGKVTQEKLAVCIMSAQQSKRKVVNKLEITK